MAQALFSLAPEGVGLIPAPMGISAGAEDVFQASFDKAEEIGTTLAKWHVDVLTQPGIPPWTVKGEEFERKWVSDMQAKTGVPFIAPMLATTHALRCVGATRVLLIHYFGNELHEGVVSYMQNRGLEVAEAPGFAMTGEDEGLYTTPLIELSKATPDVVYRFVREEARRAGRFDGVFVIGGGWDCFETIQPLETDLGVPVVYAPTATLWACLNTAGVHETIPGNGQLLSEPSNWWHDLPSYD
jgi:maleate cis-trans isomerase